MDHYRYHPNPTTQHLQCSHHQNQCLQSSDNNHQTDITHPLFHAIHHCTIIRLRHLPAQANYYYHFSIHQITPAQSQREAHLSRHLDSNPLHIDLPAHTNDPLSHSSDCHRPPIGHCDHGIPGYKALHHSRNKTLDHYRYRPNLTTQYLLNSHHQNLFLQLPDSNHQIHRLLHTSHHYLAMQTLLLQVQQHCHCHFLIHQIILA